MKTSFFVFLIVLLKLKCIWGNNNNEFSSNNIFSIYNIRKILVQFGDRKILTQRMIVIDLFKALNSWLLNLIISVLFLKEFFSYILTERSAIKLNEKFLLKNKVNPLRSRVRYFTSQLILIKIWFIIFEFNFIFMILLSTIKSVKLHFHIFKYFF